MENKDLQELIDFAINEEDQAAKFYIELSGKMDKPWMKDVLLGFAREEQGHKAKLIKLSEGGKLTFDPGKNVTDLKIADYLVNVDPSADLDYQGALIIAMKKEKAAFRLYSDLASIAEGDVKETFLALAQEEAKHKLRFEVEYDDKVLTEN